MAGQPKLVNKQFNSPIGLYSDANVRDIIERESQMLANGAVGINFHNPISAKPANLQNSAVLRMLEEEESRQRNGQAQGFKSEDKPHRAWPPPGVNNRQRRFRDVVISGVKRVAWPPPKEGDDEFSEQEAVQTQGGAQYSNQKPINQQQPLGQANSPSAAVVTNQRPSYSPQPQLTQQRPWEQSFNSQQTLLLQQVPSHQQTPQQAYSPVLQQQIRPQSPQPYNPNAQLQQQQQQTQQRPVWSPVQNQITSSPKPQQNQQQIQVQPVKTFEPPPATITLRPIVPTRQAPAPIVTSQPATATLKGGKNLRGDLKWPPENVKGKMEAENRQRMELALGPACRPRRVAKDYSKFFAEHALNSTYPGYKIPPGTQFYEHHPVM